MAALTLWLTDNDASVFSEISETAPGAEAYRTAITGWIVGTGATLRAHYDNDVEVAAASFVDSLPPDGTLDSTNGDGWRSQNAYTGSFASANWNVDVVVRANTNGGAQDGLAHARLFRSANADGSGATEITGAAQAGTTVTNLATSASQTSRATFNPGAFSLTNEYLFVQLAWERTGAGGMTTADVNMRIGPTVDVGSRVVTANFTPPATVPFTGWYGTEGSW